MAPTKRKISATNSLGDAAGMISVAGGGARGLSLPKWQVNRGSLPDRGMMLPRAPRSKVPYRKKKRLGSLSKLFVLLKSSRLQGNTINWGAEQYAESEGGSWGVGGVCTLK